MVDPSAPVRYRSRSLSGSAPGDARLFHEALRGLALGGDERIYAVGDSAVRVFDPDGKPLRHWATGRPGHAVAVDDKQRVWVGEWQQVEIFDTRGRLLDTWHDEERLGLITAIAVGDDGIFLADATRRWIHRYDEEGRLLNEIGSHHRKGGFHIPNGVVDFALDADGLLHVANPGMHRVERYSADGTPHGFFGRFDGQDPAGFPGCCNPTNLALDGRGRIVVTEKAGPRAKLYTVDGEFLGVLAADLFDRNAKNMDLAVGADGRIYIADTGALDIFVLESEEEAP